MDVGPTVTLLSNEKRLRIIQVLGDLSDPGEFSILSFSELQDVVGVRDNGNFNYHLSKLVPTFVTKADGGYRLALRGIYVYRMLVTVGYDESTLGPLSHEDECLDCGAPVAVWAEDGRVYLGCENCDVVDWAYPVPGGGMERARDAGTAAELYDVLTQRSSLDWHAMLLGFCPYCSGTVETEVNKDRSRVENPQNVGSQVVVMLACTFCRWYVHTSLEGLVHLIPTVMSFLRARGADPFRGDPTRQYEATFDIHSTDPWRVQVTTVRNEDRLRITLDGDLSVLESTVESA